MRKKVYRKQMRQRQLSKKLHKTYTFFQKRGHVVSQCWNLHPTSCPKHMRQEERNNGEGGSKDSIFNVRTNVSHEEELQQQNSLSKWLGKKWIDFLVQ